MAYRTAAGASQVIRYFYPLLAQVEQGMGYSEYLATLRDFGAEDPTALTNATIQDRQAMWVQINDQINATSAFAAAAPEAPLDFSMWSWAPGNQLTAASDAFERYQIRVTFDTTNMAEGDFRTRQVTLDGGLEDLTKENLLAEITSLLQFQVDHEDTPEAGGWGDAGPGLIGGLSDITIMRI